MTSDPIERLYNELHCMFVEAAPGIVWPEHPFRRLPVEPFPLPVLSGLEPVGEGTLNAAPINLLSANSNELRWQQTYSEADFGRDFLDRYGWTMIVGPDGPIHSEKLLSGFLLLGPGVEYPVHTHAAEEWYAVLSGEADWVIADADWRAKSPGTIVHNPPWQRHGIRVTGASCLILAFLWRAGQVEISTF